MQTRITSLTVVVLFATALLNASIPVAFAGPLSDGTDPLENEGSGLPGNQTMGGSSGGGSGITNPLGDSGSETITDVLKKVINWMLGLVGFLALIALVIGGARMIIDFGNEDQVKKAKATILWAVIGLAVVILSYAIINIVTSEILGSGSGKPYDTAPGNTNL
jgi:hypothetical protein